jgi:hypothetical protein
VDGTYNGPEGDERAIPAFYQTYAVGHHKPMVLSETSALYNTSNPTGASEADIKSTWMDQVLDPANAVRYPQLKMLNWFEHLKSEQENYGIIDWRATYNPQVLDALRAHLTAGPYLFAPN